MSVDPNSFRIGIDWDDDGFIAWGHNDPTQPSNILIGAPNLAETTGAVYTGGGAFVDKVEDEEIFDISSPFHLVKSYHVDITFTNEVIRIGRVIYDKENFLSDQMKVASTVSTLFCHMWIRSATAISAGNYSWGIRTFGSADVSGLPGTTAGSNALAIPANTWVQLTLSGALAAGADKWLEFYFSPTTGSATNIDIVNPAVSLGSFQTKFTPSTSLAAYEDLTLDTVNVDWSLGTNSPLDKISQDGQLTALLLNLDKKYFQGNTSSPIFSVIAKKHRIRLEMRLGASNWVPLWVGSSDVFSPNVVDQTTELSCVSKVYNISNGQTIIQKGTSITSNKNMMDAISELFYHNAATNPSQAETRLGISRLSQTSYLNAGNIVFSPSDVSNNPFSLNFKGLGYNQNKQGFNEIIEGLLIVAPTVWIITNRTGALVAIDFNTSASPSSDFNVDNNAVDAEYSFGEEMVNSITINYNQLRTNYGIVLPEEKDEDDDVDSIDPTTLDRYWGRKKNIGHLDRKRFKKQVKRVALPPFNKVSFSDSDPLTTYSVDDYGLGNVPPDYVYYEFDIDRVFFESFMTFTNSAPTPDSHKSSVAFEASTDVSSESRITSGSTQQEISIKNDEFLRVRFTNLNTVAGTYTVNLYTVKAHIHVILEEEQYTKTDEQSLADNGYISVKKVNYVPFLSINGFARDAAPSTFDVDYWARKYLEKYATPVAMIKSFTLIASDPESIAYSLIWSTSLGNRLHLISDKLAIEMDHLIIGEEGSITGTEIQMKYTTVGLGNEVDYI